jgi:hypothetical protein
MLYPLSYGRTFMILVAGLGVVNLYFFAIRLLPDYKKGCYNFYGVGD